MLMAAKVCAATRRNARATNARATPTTAAEPADT